MFIVKSYIVPCDQVLDNYVTKMEFETQEMAMHQVGQMLQRGHMVIVERPATGLFSASKVKYTLDMHKDPIADELIDAWMAAKLEAEYGDNDTGC